MIHADQDDALDTEFKRQLGLFDATMIVAGSMIGSGIFLVSAEMTRLIGSPGWLLVAWLITGFLTITAALSYGELVAMMPRAGGQYVFLREAISPLWAFLQGWTFVLVIQSGTIAAVAVAFARFSGVLFPGISEEIYLIAPIPIVWGYALSLSTAQLTAVLLIALLTATNTLGVQYGKLVQNVFTVAKAATLLAMIGLGLFWAARLGADNPQLQDFWTARPQVSLSDGLTALTGFGLFAAVCLAQTGSMFSADSWQNVAIIAGEIKNPRRNLPLALILGTGGVITLYLLANVAYVLTLSLTEIQNAPSDRVATAMLERMLPGLGARIMAIAIMISTFGCNNGIILSGSRASYAMARDGLFFRMAGRLNAARVPAGALILQGLWSAALVLPRTMKEGVYGNLYSDLLEYVISAALLFYILVIFCVFRLRITQPNAPRPYRAWGYPWLQSLYIVGASTILIMLLIYRPMTTWPGLLIVVLGIPVYYLWRKK